MIDAAALREWCHARAGVTEERPFGPETTVFKVEGKLFALSALEAEPPLELSLKCEPELAEALRRDHDAVRPGYHLNKRTGTPSCSTARCPTQWCSTCSRTPTTSWSARSRAPRASGSDGRP